VIDKQECSDMMTELHVFSWWLRKLLC